MNDVCLLLEGTYPYVSGGVSSWVYDLIRKLDDKTFSLLYLGAHRSGSKKMHYEIPSNVLEFREMYLFDYHVNREKLPNARGARDFEIIEECLSAIKKGDTAGFKELMRIVGNKETRSVSTYDLAYSRQSWEMIVRLYEQETREVSFLDYFWTWRFLYLPFLSILRAELPVASLYHCPSTGYAGVLGVMCKLRYNRPLILTEHGIYTRERKIEVSRADWIYSESLGQMKVTEGQDFFKQWWIDAFSFFSKLAYEQADEIITLYEGNKKIQLEEGAPPEKIRIIPNGVEYVKEERITEEKKNPVLRVGFVGRVVPIKDVKTFIMACRKIYDEIGDVEFFVLGPTDEDEAYYRECLWLAQMESMEKVIHFMGKVALEEFYPTLDVLVLTSISEAQPLVILEAQMHQIPVVATEVGACPELVFGGSDDDRLLGACGRITPIRSPEATAREVIRILKDPKLRRHLGTVGRRRATTYYQMDDLIASYQDYYTRYGEEIRWPG